MGLGWRTTASRRASVVFVVLLVGGGACSAADVATRADRVRPTTTTSSTRPVASTISTTTTTATSTTVPAPPPSAPPATAVLPLTGPEPARSTSCADALAYLAAHQAPGFVDSCGDGSAFGHLGVTCVDVATMCPGVKFIHIACPAPFVYMNEAHNSWTLTGHGSGIDPYGQGTAADRAACAPHR